MKIRTRALAFRLSMYIMLGVILIFGGILLYNYHSSRKFVIQQAEASAVTHTANAVLQIENILRKVEQVPLTLAKMLEYQDLSPEQIQSLFLAILEDTPEIFGICIGFEPYSYFPDSQYYAPYAWRKDNHIRFANIGNTYYDYFHIDWYQIPALLREPVWAEPYFDEYGGDEVMSTFAVPFYQMEKGERTFGGIVTADISLDWLRTIVDSLQVFEEGFGMLFSRNGRILTHPNPDFIMNHSIFSLGEEFNQPYLREIGRSMQRGERGFRKVQPVSIDRRSWMFYEPLQSNRWSLALIFPEDLLFADLVSLNRQLMLLGMIGLLLLVAIIGLLSKRITGPLEDLAKVADRMGKGELDIAVPSYKSMDEVAMLGTAFQRMKEELGSYVQQLQETTSAKERIESELRIAHDIQMGIIPRIFPPFPDRDQIDIYAVLDPAREVGGDLYDFFFIDEEHLCVAIGDVSGKGIPASLLMAISRTLLRAKSIKGNTVSDILTSMNQELCAENDNAMFVTFILAILNVETGELLLSNAGHNYPCLIRSQAALTCIRSTHGIPLGLFPVSSYPSDHICLDVNDLLVLYTDGVTEAMNEREELYGEDRLMTLLSGQHWSSPRKLTEAVVADVRAFSGSAEQSDDITMLCLQWKGNGASPSVGHYRELRLRNTLDDIKRLAAFTEDLSVAWQLSGQMRFQLNLVLEELITNVIFYAYSDLREHLIKIRIWKEESSLRIEVEDDGKPFNPLMDKEPIDMNLPLEEREPGGLGIHFVRSLTHNLQYNRSSDRNLLCFSMNINKEN